MRRSRPTSADIKSWYISILITITLLLNLTESSFYTRVLSQLLHKTIFQPHNHKEKVAKYYWATPELVKKAIDVAVKAQREWERWPIEKRLEMWLRISDLMATKYRQHLNAATMLGQSKTVIQAEIDSAAELIDFFKMHAYFVKESLKYQPISPNQQTLNSMRYRGMDGFVAAVSPFNFTAIGGNLSYTPALMVCNLQTILTAL